MNMNSYVTQNSYICVAHLNIRALEYLLMAKDTVVVSTSNHSPLQTSNTTLSANVDTRTRHDGLTNSAFYLKS